MSFAFVQIKVFGDLTIAASALRRLPPSARGDFSLLIGPHLSGLCELLAPECRVDRVSIEGVGNAALFDIRNQGWIKALGTAPRWRSALSAGAPGSTLVFDKLTPRERFVAGGRRALALPQAPNVYAAYERFLQASLPGTPLLARPAQAFSGRTAGIFPVSRIEAKSLPVDLVRDLAKQCRSQGFEPIVILLEGEKMEAGTDIPVRVLPRNFQNLIEAIRGFDAVLSADSLPAHLAEYFGRPVFVASPVPNAYWLPASSFGDRYWGVFTERPALQSDLHRFLGFCAAPGPALI